LLQLNPYDGCQQRGEAVGSSGRAISVAGECPAIEARLITQVYRTRTKQLVPSLDNVSISCDPGEFVTIVGPSGCGKSTLLKILAGLLRPTSGEVLLRGEPLTEPTREIGMAFQMPILLPWRNVTDNVLLAAQVQGERNAFRSRARELLELVGLVGFEDKYPRELSGGMQQRVAIVRALLTDPSILLMDEPFGALDAMTREQINVDIQAIWQAARKTFLLVTHSISEAVFLGDRVLVMTPRPGRMVMQVDVNLPRPRTLDVMTTPDFGEIVSTVRSALTGPASETAPTAARVAL
jgi:NitT/TauT family transport system ATP-binding protein